MPELPEAQAIVNELKPKLTGRRICRVHACDEKFALQIEEFGGSDRIRGSEIRQVQRRGKAIILDLCGGFSLLIQLGMTGGLLLSRGECVPDYVRYWLKIEDGPRLFFRDPRKFGRITGYQRGDSEYRPAFLKTLGPDPFFSVFDARYLQERAKDRTISVKEFIMDQRVVAGIGNIYASEILFSAGIDPRPPASVLDPPAWEKIVHHTRTILRRAIEYGGTTIRDFRRPDERQGAFKKELRVYGREKELCVRCRSVLRKIRQGNRSTFFCPGCQRGCPLRG